MPKLRPRELEAIRLFHQGKSEKEVMVLLVLVPTTLEDLRKRVFEQLGVSTWECAYGEAEKLGYLKDN